MKIITTILAICFAVVTAALIYLIKAGVSIRTAPIIKPSVIATDFKNVPQGLFLRLFPDFQMAHYTIWGIDSNSPEVQLTLATVKDLYEKEFKATVNFINVLDFKEGSAITLSETIKNCPKPCWVLMPEKNANELSPNPWIEKNIKFIQREYFTLTWINFSKNADVPDYCLKEKRLDLGCLKSVSVQEVQRKMKNPNERYFFVRKYMDKDYFLFVENP